MLNQVFNNIADDAIIEDVPQPWIFAMLSAVNTETAAEGRTVSLNSKSTVLELKNAIQKLHYEAQIQILSRTFTRYTTDMKESPTLNESIHELEHEQLKRKIVAVTVYTFLGLIVLFVVANIAIALLGMDREIDEKLGASLFSTLMEVINLLFS